MYDHCCEQMTRQVDWHCDTHADPYACPDALVTFSAKFREYGLIIHDGGTARIGIDFCPWCGLRLPESQRDRWFEELEARGIDPWEDEVPAEFEDGSWLVTSS
ncbi:hypothetical protein Q3V23_31595 [Streptomyces sp. VNUA116]|uniref:DUF6980 family protein n=1 Tax=Streptomyces sp. VNUA116 TaxID=3062449 RepID=UPI00267494C1|nr:hypothetical protein [Streptomyces sp. VNUA116]WKU48243.1 hypothetical protein Q3V23_31595 [Streptomyces sp. VNUA116]